MDKMIGRKLDGRYEIKELIGVGGMADIYKAYDSIEDKIAAVKILKNEFAESEDFLRRFRNESKAIALLSHPNIVKIYDVGFTDKIQFIVMEYIDGITLNEYIEKQGVLKWRDAVHFTIQILRALQHAHDRGIVHRDIKPQNVMLLQDGTIKVMDFGIARFARETGKTLSEKAIGSVHYISPEQARGELTDEKSDIYSVGVMLYEMLTGKKPYDGDTPVAIALKHMQSPCLKPSEINPDIPQGLEEIVIRAMQKESDKRYQSASEMIKDIEEFKKDSSIVFEYKYMTNNEATKYFDAVNPDKNKKPTKAQKIDEEDEIEDEEEEEEKTKKSPFVPILFAVASAFVIMASIIIGVFIVSGFGGGDGKEIEMPDLKGMTLEEVAEKYPGFKVEQTDPENSADYEEGKICNQEPEPGKVVKTKRTITVTVSLGPVMVDIEDVKGKTYEMAKKVLEKQGFGIIQQLEYSEDVEEGLVIRTDPEAGTSYAQGKSVKIIVSNGKMSVNSIMPSVVGMTKEAAKNALEAAGITTATFVDVDSTADEGKVISQTPSEKTVVGADTAVKISVSTGKAPTYDVTLNVAIPTGYSGDREFAAYYNGEKIKTAVLSLDDAKNWDVEITGKTGTGNVTIKIIDKNGTALKFAEYTVNFEGQTYNLVSQDNSALEKTAAESTQSTESKPESSSSSNNSENSRLSSDNER